MEDKVYLYSFNFTRDCEVNGIKYLKYERYGLLDIDFATTAEQARDNIENFLFNSDIGVENCSELYNLYRNGLLELKVYEITLIETQHFMYEK